MAYFFPGASPITFLKINVDLIGNTVRNRLQVTLCKSWVMASVEKMSKGAHFSEVSLGLLGEGKKEGRERREERGKRRC